MADGIETRVHELEAGLNEVKIEQGRHGEKFKSIEEKFDTFGDRIDGIGSGLSVLRGSVMKWALALIGAIVVSGIANGLLARILNGGAQ